MDSGNVQTANRPGRIPDRRRKTAQSQQKSVAPDFQYESDRSSTLDSLKFLMAANQRDEFRHGKSRQDDILFAAKRARAQMPPQFREPPSSTGSHGTITASSIHLDNNNDGTCSSTPSSSAFSAGPDAESTRASVHFQRGCHRVHKTTGRFSGSEDGDGSKGKKKTVSNILNGIANTSALFRTFKEWRPDDETDLEIFRDQEQIRDHDDHSSCAEDNPSTTNFGVLDNLAQYDKENHVPPRSSPPITARPLERRERAVLQPTVQNESDMSIVISAAVHEQSLGKKSIANAASSLRQEVLATATTQRTTNGKASKNSNNKKPQVTRQPSPLLDELTSPETSADTGEDVKPGIETVLAPEDRIGSAAVAGKTESRDAATSQSFIVPSKSFPLLHNIVTTGTLRFTPGAFFYGTSVDAQRKYQLPPGPVPNDEKEIFIDVENIRKEVIRLQEHDEMLQDEIFQGEKKYRTLLERFYSSTHKSSDSGFNSGSELAQPLKDSQEQNQALQTRIMELEVASDLARTRDKEQAQVIADLTTQRNAALQRAASFADKCNKLAADAEAVREKLATSSHRPNQLTRRVQQLEQMVAERDRVIKALKDEREAANSSRREECRLHKDHIARINAEKNMLSGDHAKCAEEKATLAATKNALAQRKAALKEQVHAMRQQCRDREATFHAVVDRQRTQIAKLQLLLKNKETSMRQLDEDFRKLRESWSSKDETLMRMTEVFQAWPGGFSSERWETMHTEATTEDEEKRGKRNDADNLTTDHDEYQSDFGEQEEEGIPNNHKLPFTSQQQKDIREDSDNDASDVGQSAMDHSVEENMTSAFIIPDLDFQTEENEDEDECPAELPDDEKPDGPKATSTETRNPTDEFAASQKTVSFRTNKVMHTVEGPTGSSASPASTLCKHSQVNCVICCQKAGPPLDNEKVTVAVPRPILANGAEAASVAAEGAASYAQRLAAKPGMSPGDALAYVMKLLNDERRHLWMQIQASRKEGAAEETRNETARRPRQVSREPEELWKAYVLKVEQLNRLDDVLEGQRVAGQDMSREMIDVTITRILQA
ncbi:hypothetical protein SPI_03902 [Niveomyces insectorum RCEF 264]|uniref:Uncharacterized protein n=1 Tax=Niveomyces insectorum RCEF 264 TaxID=1081102 RepID=A0A167WFW1_9HYPO|nr:hypothetical protein SPI_03902 [Niveomyces insectorum RCEF 264]